MAHFETRILNVLLDSYEKSSLFRGDNKVAVHISFRFTKSSLPEYFDESSLSYESIHAWAHEMEEKGWLEIAWKSGKEGHIIERLILDAQKVPEIYQYLRRKPLSRLICEQLEIIRSARETCSTPVAECFLAWLEERLLKNRPVKEFIDLACPEDTERLLQAVTAIEENEKESYQREFSIREFADSKALEKLEGKLGKIFRTFSEEFKGMETEDILAEYGIYHTPNYIYLKGEGVVDFGNDENACLKLSAVRQGIGISGEDLSDIRISGTERTKKVITIENLTTFFRWEEKDALIIYLGGYHNRVRRTLLEKIYREMPEIQYLHFGDIDVGGFEIYEDLCRKTGIPFLPYHMGLEELSMYREFSRPLTENDKRRLKRLMEQAESDGAPYLETLQLMMEWGIKLEQECIR